MDEVIDPNARAIGTREISRIQSSALQTPAASPTSGRGSGGSGNSRQNSGSSGGGGEGSTTSPQSGGSGDKKMYTIMQWVLSIAGLITAICTVVLIMWKTSSDGLKQETEQKALEHKELDLKLAKERTKHLRFEAKKGQAQAHAAEAAPPAPVMAQPVKDCIIASTWFTSRENPIPLGNNLCLMRNQESSNFWVIFKADPREIVGIASFNEMAVTIGNDGQNQLIEVSRCITSQSQDQCLSYLKGKLGIPLVVFNNTSSIQINM